MGFCPSGLLSQWAFVQWAFVLVGFCPSGLLSYTRIDELFFSVCVLILSIISAAVYSGFDLHSVRMLIGQYPLKFEGPEYPVYNMSFTFICLLKAVILSWNPSTQFSNLLNNTSISKP